MPRDGSGNYARAVDPYVGGDIAEADGADGVNTEMDDIADALSDSLARNGEAPFTGDQDAAGFTVGGLRASTANGEAVRHEQLSAYMLTDALVAAIAGLTVAAGDVIYATGVDLVSTAPSTSFGRSIWNAADAAALRTLAALGTAALATIGTSGDTVPKNNTANVFSAQQDIQTSAARGLLISRDSSVSGPSFALRAKDSGGNYTDYALDGVTIADSTDGSEDGSRVFQIIVAGALVTQLTLSNALATFVGGGTFGGAVLAAAGSAAAPSLSFSGDPDTGLYSSGTNAIGFARAGVVKWRMTGTVFQAEGGTGSVSMPDAVGSVSVPAYGFAGDENTGMYRIGADQGGFAAGGVNISKFDSAGHKDASDNLWQVGGKHLIPLRAAAFTAQTTNGAAAYSAELATNDQMITGYAFDASTDEFIQLEIPMPKSWNEGTFTARFRWYAPSGSGNVVWGIQALCVGDDDALDAAWGTAQIVTDGLTATGDLMISAETSAVTAAGSPAEGDTLILRVYRDANHASDTFSADAILLGVDLFISITGSNDA